MKAAIVLAAVLGIASSTGWSVTLKPEAQRKRAPNFAALVIDSGHPG